MKFRNPRPVVPILLLLTFSGWTGRELAGEQRTDAVDKRVKAAALSLQTMNEAQRLRAAVDLLQLGKHAEPAVPQLMASLHDSQVGFPAALTLGQIGKPAVGPLVAFLKESRSGDRTLALFGLSWIGPSAEEATPIVRELLKSDDPGLAAMAAYTLARINPKDRPAAIEALQDLVSRLNDPGATLVLLAWLRPEDTRPLVKALVGELRNHSCMFGQFDRLVGAYGLAELGPAAISAVPDLREALTDREPVVRALAAYSLAQLSAADRPDAVRTLMEIADRKPGQESLEFQLGLQSSKKLEQVELAALEAVVDVLITHNPGDRFPAHFILTWAKQGLRQSKGDVGEWLRASPLSTNLAREMVRRLEAEESPEANRLPQPEKSPHGVP